MFKKILIANRGEIAMRIIVACRELDIKTVAVYSEADEHALHVRFADEDVRIGPARSSESYLNVPAIISAAEITGADAIHPGYGFLSESAYLAEVCEACHIRFIGPDPKVIRLMGDKARARRAMKRAGLPLLPGTDGPVENEEAALKFANTCGFPVIVKATAGGGGRGMRVVRDAAQLEPAVATTREEALRAFGSGEVYMERFLEHPRHVEIQVLADRERTIHLGERECSVQRRHQKLVEEAPSIAVSPGLRERMGAAAVAAAKAVGYRSAGTCEFLLLPDGSFYFLEMNTRIQVEHPVTELVYGVDLVREQLRIAKGEPMQVPEGTLSPRGWALECRITSEDSANGFLPSTGKIDYLKPPAGPGVRWDSGIEIGDEVTLYYDSMLAKLIVWAPDRLQALARMTRALNELVITGVATNQGFHRRLIADAAFARGEIDIQFLDRRPDLTGPDRTLERVEHLAIAAALAEDSSRQSRLPLVAADTGPGSEWARQARSEALR